MTRTRLTLWVMAARLGCAAPALAQDATPNITHESVEIIPFGGARTGGGVTGELDGASREFGFGSGASYGGVLDFNLHKNNFKLELLYSRQRTEIESANLLVRDGLKLNIEYLQGGLLQEVGSEKSRFYVSVLLGASRFSPEGFDSETKFSLSLGGGLKFFPSRHVGLRFDARAFLSFVKSDVGGVCANGRCIFSYSGSHMTQGDFTGGLILAF